jgi:purine-binding chemotaxis protein CheW
MTAIQQFCTFSVEGLHLAVDVARVQEVIRHQGLTRVPTAPPVVRGLINLRGQIVTAIDLRRRLELTPLRDDDRPMNVVLRADDGAVSLLVDEIGDVLELRDAELEPPPETVAPVVRELITGIYQHRDRLLLILDPDRVLAPAGVGPAAAPFRPHAPALN